MFSCCFLRHNITNAHFSESIDLSFEPERSYVGKHGSSLPIYASFWSKPQSHICCEHPFESTKMTIRFLKKINVEIFEYHLGMGNIFPYPLN